MSDEQEIELVAPTLVWLPPAAVASVRLRAGCDGAMFSAPESLAWRTVGESAVGMQLRPLLTRLLIAPAPQIKPQLAELMVSFDVLIRESREQRSGSSAMINAHIALVMLHLWRASGDTAQAQQPRGAGAATVQRFHQLVELHYKDHISVASYARLLGVTRSHLHDSCLRLTKRTPLVLVHERLLAEARMRLQQTSLSIEQIGYALGFRDPGYFSRFFKKASGQSPGAFRQAASNRHVSDSQPHSFAAWP